MHRLPQRYFRIRLVSLECAGRDGWPPGGNGAIIGGNGGKLRLCPAEVFLYMGKQISVSQMAISDWVAGLAAIPEREFTLQNVQDYIIAHAVKPETLDEVFAFFERQLHTQPDFQKRFV